MSEMRAGLKTVYELESHYHAELLRGPSCQ
jgi:hypothetical protein